MVNRQIIPGPILEAIKDKENAYTYIESKTTSDKRYKVRLYLTCECIGFATHGYCDHVLNRAMQPDVEWTWVTPPHAH